MAELRRISSSSGNGSMGNPHPRSNGEDNQRQTGYDNSSYELESVQTERKGTAEKGGQDEMPAVVVRGVSKYYKKGVPVLQNLNMTVQRGAIYSLLGSSGCGKTTTLSCLVGTRIPQSGEIYTFGAKPGEKGKMVGYMPQETSLYGDFSIAETLSYFGTLCGMDREAAKRGTNFLIKLLSLPESSRRVGTLSGGQRRRVSFAVALIHDPQLLILDEPTVGVDPLLREHIWNHLVHLSKERGTTVLITTHYIDEAKESTAVGVMRYGRLLVEQDPAQLLESFNTTSLEAVVLQLCKKDTGDSDEKEGEVDLTKINEIPKLEYDVQTPDDTKFVPPVDNDLRNEQIFNSMTRIKSLMHKNLVVQFRNLLLFFFSAIMPSFITYIMCIAFKDDPKNLDFGVVNYEVPNLTHCLNIPPYPPGECDIENLSCQYLKHLLPYGVVDLKSYETEDQAITAVHEGSVWGYMVFPQEYSSFFYERSASGSNIDDEVFNKSEIVVKMDQTSKNIVNRVKKSFADSYEDYARSILKNCGFDERQAEFALNYHEPIFGTDDTKFIDFVAPSITVAWLFFFPIIASSIRYINEKKQGTYERSLVAGTKTWEILFAYGCTECIVLVVQSCLIYFVLNVIVGIDVLGSFWLVMLLFIMSGFGGVSMGFFIGSLCNEEIEAALLAMAIFFPNMALSGIIWPIEGMPIVLQYIAYLLPCTLTSEAMRSIFTRGWPFSHPNVWPGYISLFGYILLYFLLTVLIQKFKSK